MQNDKQQLCNTDVGKINNQPPRHLLTWDSVPGIMTGS